MLQADRFANAQQAFDLKTASNLHGKEIEKEVSPPELIAP